MRVSSPGSRVCSGAGRAGRRSGPCNAGDSSGPNPAGCTDRAGSVVAGTGRGRQPADDAAPAPRRTGRGSGPDRPDRNRLGACRDYGRRPQPCRLCWKTNRSFTAPWTMPAYPPPDAPSPSTQPHRRPWRLVAMGQVYWHPIKAMPLAVAATAFRAAARAATPATSRATTLAAAARASLPRTGPGQSARRPIALA
jgi:hypothetical protein